MCKRSNRVGQSDRFFSLLHCIAYATGDETESMLSKRPFLSFAVVFFFFLSYLRPSFQFVVACISPDKLSCKNTGKFCHMLTSCLHARLFYECVGYTSINSKQTFLNSFYR